MSVAVIPKEFGKEREQVIADPEADVEDAKPAIVAREDPRRTHVLDEGFGIGAGQGVHGLSVLVGME